MKVEINGEEYVREKELKEKPEGIEKDTTISSYKYMSDIDWSKKEAVLNTNQKEKQIFVNQKFADKSKFNDNCVFIKCEFGSCCEFGLDCEFDSFCKRHKPY